MKPADPQAPLRRLVWAFSLASLLLLAVLAHNAGPLRTAAAPLGTTSLMFAGEAHTARAILQSWRAAGVLGTFQTQMGLDALFPCLYPVALGAGLWLLGGRTLARLQPLAGLLDHLENALLLGYLQSPPADPWPAVGWLLSALKYSLALAGALALVMLLLHRLARAAGRRLARR